jgi:hypothetical protein
VRTWRNKTIPDRKKAEAEKAAKEASKPPTKRGSKKGVLPIRSIPEHKKGRICNALLLEICNMITASLTAGLPLCRPILRPQILSALRHNNITWEPSKAWYTNCLWKPRGLKWRRATHARLAKPVDEEGTTRTFLMRVFYLVRKYDIPQELFLNCDETGLNLSPTPDYTDAGVDKRQYSLLFAIDADEVSLDGSKLSGRTYRRKMLSTNSKRTALPCSSLLFPHWNTTETTKTYVKNLYDEHVLWKLRDWTLGDKSGCYFGTGIRSVVTKELGPG